MKILDLFNEINLVYGMISEYCTEQSCPVMTAALPTGHTCEYCWADGDQIKTPIKVSAPQYMDYLFAWVQRSLDDETLFPTAPGVDFPAHFHSTMCALSRRLFRVFAHTYHNHYERVVELEFLPHLNTCFKHFTYFVQEFGLVRSEELQPLQLLIDELLAIDQARWPNQASRGSRLADCPNEASRALGDSDSIVGVSNSVDSGGRTSRCSSISVS